MSDITIDFDLFRASFPEFKDVQNEVLSLNLSAVPTYISMKEGAVGLKVPLQVRACYLALAHTTHMSLNPDKFRQISSATEGSVSASFSQSPTTNIRDYWLSLSSYGLELLYILSTIQPPTIIKPNTSYPYYGG
nr:MAG TPA: head to tail adaptor [Caudoviricetes sp.]